jgi:hypothetical protein
LQSLGKGKRKNSKSKKKKGIYTLEKEVFIKTSMKELPWRGLEPPRTKQLILNQRCLPFHHQGITISNGKTKTIKSTNSNFL